jgi:cytochrome c
MPANRLTCLLVVAAAIATPTVFAAGSKPDIDNGKTVFGQMCGICHAVSNDPGGPAVGPNMVGLVGRKAASAPGFMMYSAALKKHGVTWNAKTLDDFLVNPMQKVPGTTMPMMLADPKVRADVIGYLATLKK